MLSWPCLSVCPSVCLWTRLRSQGRSDKKNNSIFVILSPRRINLRELFSKIENFFLPIWYAFGKKFRIMAKYFSWVICQRRKPCWENFKYFGHSFTKKAYLKLQEIKLGACKCNQAKSNPLSNLQKRIGHQLKNFFFTKLLCLIFFSKRYTELFLPNWYTSLTSLIFFCQIGILL